MFIRSCQSCGYRRPSKPPTSYKSNDESWRYIKCPKCKSEDFDYGSDRSEEEEEEEEEE